MRLYGSAGKGSDQDYTWKISVGKEVTSETKMLLIYVFEKKIVCLQSQLNMEHLDQIISEQQIMKNKRNICFPHISNLTSAAQIIQW
jgi:hypothetical protein